VIIVALVAVLAGFIIGRGLSNRSSGTATSPGGTSNGGSSGAATTAKGGSTKGGTSTTVAPSAVATTTTISLRAFTAIVLNGNGIQGTAAARSTELGALGLKMAPAADATTKNFAASALYATNAESAAAATALADRTGIKYEGLFPTANPPAPTEKLGGATIVLLLGKDIANVAISDKGAAAAPTTVAAATTSTTVKK
jgi:hypothetical protein